MPAACLLSDGLYVVLIWAQGRAVFCSACYIICPRPPALVLTWPRRPLPQARANAASLGLSGRTRFICSHWLDKVDGDFDLILANPPYIESADQTLARDVADHDPARALFAGPDGLDAYRELLPQITDVLRPMGRLFLEIGSQQARPVTQLATAAVLQLCALIADLSGRDRCLILCKK